MKICLSTWFKSTQPVSYYRSYHFISSELPSVMGLMNFLFKKRELAWNRQAPLFYSILNNQLQVARQLLKFTAHTTIPEAAPTQAPPIHQAISGGATAVHAAAATTYPADAPMVHAQ
jgi:hypothetical protein